MLTNMAVELSHFLYFLISDSVRFMLNPESGQIESPLFPFQLHFDTFTATIFTIDFFLNCLNVSIVDVRIWSALSGRRAKVHFNRKQIVQTCQMMNPRQSINDLLSWYIFSISPPH